MDLKTAYLEDWMDIIDALPIEIQRNFTLIKEKDAAVQRNLRAIESSAKKIMDKNQELTSLEKQKLLKQLTEEFNDSFKYSESKVALATQTYDIIDKHIRRLDEDLMKFEDELTITGPRMEDPDFFEREERTSKSSSKKRKDNDGSQKPANRRREPPKQRQRNQSKGIQMMEDSRKSRSKGPGDSVDPNEPTYCICNQVSFGAMIACDNEDCDIEWFHYECVGLDSPPKGKWYCADCRKKLGLS